jgi:hypothetical protein
MHQQDTSLRYKCVVRGAFKEVLEGNSSEALCKQLDIDVRCVSLAYDGIGADETSCSMGTSELLQEAERNHLMSK